MNTKNIGVNLEQSPNIFLKEVRILRVVCCHLSSFFKQEGEIDIMFIVA